MGNIDDLEKEVNDLKKKHSDLEKKHSDLEKEVEKIKGYIYRIIAGSKLFSAQALHRGLSAQAPKAQQQQPVMKLKKPQKSKKKIW